MKKNTGSTFESYVQYVYQTLLNTRGEKIQVSKRALFFGLAGEKYEVDIYYEFEKVGIRHRVAIECKDWSRPVSQGQILEFHQKIKNIGNELVGIVVSKIGFQSGAKEVAARHGILLETQESLPTLGQLVAGQIISAAVHEPNLIGEPFWVVVEKDSQHDGYSNGNYYAFPEGTPVKFPLFFSKFHAQKFAERIPDKDKFYTYGLPQYKLRFLIGCMELNDMKLGLVYGEPDEMGRINIAPIDCRELKKQFLLC